MAGTIIYCGLCDAAYGSVGDLPTHCPNCKRETKWRTSPPHGHPAAVVLPLTANDRRLLRGFKIDPEG